MDRKPCARCGRALKAEDRIFSQWTRNYYCVALDACSKRAKRRASRAVEEAVA